MNKKRKIKSLLIISDGYPSLHSQACVFVQNLVTAVADLGVKCIVIAPVIMTLKNLLSNEEYLTTDYSLKGSPIKIYRPYYLHLSSRKGLLKYSMANHFRAVLRVIEKEHLQPDAIYGHFIYQCGLTAARLSKKLHIPAFLGAGESDKLLPNSKRCRGAYQLGIKNYSWQKILGNLAGIIAVSEWTKKLLIEGQFIDERLAKKITVLPNGINLTRFVPEEKGKARDNLKIDKDDFVVIFVGAFNSNKGSQRLSVALERIGNVKSIFIGRPGECIPSCPGIIFCGQCANEKITQYLQAADCFVLPTRSEGCCNAILEALATGLPVISSDLPFNDGILTNENSIRIDPDDIDQLEMAIRKLKEDHLLRDKLSKGALNGRERLSIEKRAELVIDFMQDICNHY